MSCMARKFFTIFLGCSVFLFIPLFASADTLSQQSSFFIDSDFDESERSEVASTLRKVTNQLYFYVEDAWWNLLSVQRRNDILGSLDTLALNFEGEIYPSLTGLFGTENNPGIDEDSHITVLIHRMKENIRGYFNTADGYTKFETSTTNEREMVYLAVEGIETPLAKSYLAHEFAHLIYFNQKEVKQNISDEIWIQEGFAELAPTFVGYDDNFEGSYLEKRVRDFMSNPRDSLTEWRGFPADYGVVNMFFQYLKDQYGTQVFIDMLKAPTGGISSINEALASNNTGMTFAALFSNWTIAMLINDCSFGEVYCFANENLQNVKVAPFTNFLSPFGESQLTVTNQTKNWAGNWHKISGGSGRLEVKFDGNPEVAFIVPYVVQKESGEYIINAFDLSEDQEGVISIDKFGSENSSVIIIPSIQDKLSDFETSEPAYLFSWTVSTTMEEEANTPNSETTLPIESPDETDEAAIQLLLQQIVVLKAEIARLQNLLAGQTQTNTCTFQTNLFYGIENTAEVRCLQQFLKDQGPSIYSEGLVTGNFLSLTRAAVIRFQEKYTSEILTPVDEIKGTGYVGPLTRKKMNELRSLP